MMAGRDGSLTSAVLTLQEIRDMTAEMLEAQRAWLPQFAGKRSGPWARSRPRPAPRAFRFPWTGPGHQQQVRTARDGLIAGRADLRAIPAGSGGSAAPFLFPARLSLLRAPDQLILGLPSHLHEIRAVARDAHAQAAVPTGILLRCQELLPADHVHLHLHAALLEDVPSRAVNRSTPSSPAIAEGWMRMLSGPPVIFP